MDVRDFDFHLPQELIAQEPPARRTSARLLVLNRASGDLHHATVAQLPDLLTPGDLVVVNNTRVFPARLLGRRVPSGGAVECLLIRRISGDRWEALVHPGQKLKPGTLADFTAVTDFDSPRRPVIHAEILERRFYGRREIRLWNDDGSSIDDAIDAIGHVPLPPYIKRADRVEDRDRYQTVFARERGSVAAPTAGLHFTVDLASALGARGIDLAEVTLHVGYGTFQPVRADRVEEHHVDAEWYSISPAASAAINGALGAGRRIVAVGTTTTRALESAALQGGGTVAAGEGETDLFIHPGFSFRVIRGLLTNFHLPRSSLLMLVSAFAGREKVLRAYETAIAEGYRFYSYGDAMLIV